MYNKEVENIKKKLNEYRSNLMMNQIDFSIKEYELLIELSKDINNQEILLQILKNYYFNNSLEDYINLFKLISRTVKNIHKEEDNKVKNIVTKDKLLENKQDDKTKLKVDDKNLLNIINSYFENNFLNDRNYYYLKDNSIGVLTMKSRVYKHSSYKYWYTYHKYQQKALEKYNERYMLLYFKDSEDGLIIPTSFIEQYKDKLGKSIYKENNDIGIHIHIQKIDGEYFLRIPYAPLVPLKDFKLKQEKVEVIKISSEYRQINIKRKK